VALVLVAVAGCGGGGGGPKSTSAKERVAGPGFDFAVPSGWQVSRANRSVIVKQGSGPELVSVNVLPLRKPYKPALFTRAARELDRLTEALAGKLNGKVIARRSIVVAGVSARQYDVAYERDGAGLIDRITYVLRGRSEYYLLCRWPADAGEPTACAVLTDTFRLR
jgi:hypothetical protein